MYDVVKYYEKVCRFVLKVISERESFVLYQVFYCFCEEFVEYVLRTVILLIKMSCKLPFLYTVFSKICRRGMDNLLQSIYSENAI